MMHVSFARGVANKKITSSDRHLKTLFLCMDGNFKLRNVAKNNNALDRSLWRGQGFLCSKADIDAHVTEFGNITVEVSESGYRSHRN